jgi:hypothetical protein
MTSITFICGIEGDFPEPTVRELAKGACYFLRISCRVTGRYDGRSRQRVISLLRYKSFLPKPQFFPRWFLSRGS